MTDSTFQREMLTAIGGLTREVGELTVSVRSLESRVGNIEQEERQDDRRALDTGRHEVGELRAELARREAASKKQAADRKAALRAFAIKAALLVAGSVLATVAPALAKVMGL